VNLSEIARFDGIGTFQKAPADWPDREHVPDPVRPHPLRARFENRAMKLSSIPEKPFMLFKFPSQRRWSRPRGRMTGRRCWFSIIALLGRNTSWMRAFSMSNCGSPSSASASDSFQAQPPESFDSSSACRRRRSVFFSNFQRQSSLMLAMARLPVFARLKIWRRLELLKKFVAPDFRAET